MRNSGSAPKGAPTKHATLNLPGFLRDCRELVAATDPLLASGKLTRVAGLVLEASGLKLAVGSCCQVSLPNGHCVEAEVVGFSEDRLFLMPINDVYGLTPGARVTPLEVAQNTGQVQRRVLGRSALRRGA